jgi:hypothetical protein
MIENRDFEFVKVVKKKYFCSPVGKSKLTTITVW